MLFAAAAAAERRLPPFGTRSSGADVDAIDLARGLAYTLLYVYAVKVAAVFMVVVSTIALHTVTLPRWLVCVGFGIAIVLLLSVSFFELLVLLFPVWVATREHRHPRRCARVPVEAGRRGR